MVLLVRVVFSVRVVVLVVRVVFLVRAVLLVRVVVLLVRVVFLVRVVLLVRVVWRGCAYCCGVRGRGRLGEEAEEEAATLESGEERNEDVETQKLRPVVELEV